MSDSVQLIGAPELARLLQELPNRSASKGNKASATAAAKPFRIAAKSKAPRESNLLAKSIGTKIKTYRTGAGTIAVAITGARRDVQGTYKNRRRVPANYIHLVNAGTSHSKASHFMDEAYREAKSAAAKAGMDKLKSVIEKEAIKLGKK